MRVLLGHATRALRPRSTKRLAIEFHHGEGRHTCRHAAADKETES